MKHGRTLVLITTGALLILPFACFGQSPPPDPDALVLGAVRDILRPAARDAVSIDSQGRRLQLDVGRNQARAGDLAGARQTAATATRADDRSLILVEIATVQAGLGDLPAAMSTLRAVPEEHFRNGALREIAEEQALMSGDVAAALQIMGPSPGRVSLNRLARTAALRAFLRGDVGTVIRLEAPIKQDEPDLFHADVAMAYAWGGDTAAAIQTAGLINSTSMRAGALAGIAAAEAQLDAVDSALKTAGLISDPRSHEEALMDCLAITARAGNVAAANKIAAAIKGDHNRPHAEFLRARAHLRAGDIPGAQQVLKGPDAERWISSISHEIAAAQARTGNIRGAIQTVEVLRESSKIEGFAIVAKVQAEAGDVAGAQATAALVSTGREQVLWAIATARARRGDAQPLLALAGALPSPVSRAEALQRVADLLLREVQDARTERTFGFPVDPYK